MYCGLAVHVDVYFYLSRFYMLIKTYELLAEKEKYKNISEELDQTLNELQVY